MAKNKYFVTYEFTTKDFMNDFIDSVNESPFAKYVEFKMIKTLERPLTTAEDIINKIREIIGKEDG